MTLGHTLPDNTRRTAAAFFSDPAQARLATHALEQAVLRGGFGDERPTVAAVGPDLTQTRLGAVAEAQRLPRPVNERRGQLG